MADASDGGSSKDDQTDDTMDISANNNGSPRDDRTSDTMVTSIHSSSSPIDNQTSDNMVASEQSSSSIDNRTEQATVTSNQSSSSSIDNRTEKLTFAYNQSSISSIDNLTENPTVASDQSSSSSREDDTSDTIAKSDQLDKSPKNERMPNHGNGSSGDEGLAIARVGRGDQIQCSNQIVQLLKVKVTGNSPCLIGDKPTVNIYNTNDNESQTLGAVANLEQKMDEIKARVDDNESQTLGAVANLEQKMDEIKARVDDNESQTLGAVANLDHKMDDIKACVGDNESQTLGAVANLEQKMDEIKARVDDNECQTLGAVANLDHKMDDIKACVERSTVYLTEQHTIIDQTENLIADQQHSAQFITTKAFEIAKKMIKEKRYVVIRGESGAGKTRLALELMAWLNSGAEKNVFHCKKPIRLPNLQIWDKTIRCNSNLSILLDDIFGCGSSDTTNDVTWWKQHADMIKAITFGEDETANFLIMTVRNDVFKYYKSIFNNVSLFDDENVINLSSPDYILKEERQNMLRLYTPISNSFQPFSESEINQIVDCSSAIGFPECCRLFQITPELHIHRVRYFESPLQKLKHVIMERFNEGKQTALLYLLLATADVSTTFLDFEHDDFDINGIERAFKTSSHVFSRSSNNTNDIGNRHSLQQGLDSLCDAFVRKEKGIYRFFHDSIRDTIAILYGECSPSGFLRNCPSSCLHYITTGKCTDNLCKVVIKQKYFEIVYERILRELESKTHDNFIHVASILSWNDVEFLNCFFDWIKKQESVPCDFFIHWKTEKVIYTREKRILNDVDNIPNDSCSFLHCVAKTDSLCLLTQLVNMMNVQKNSSLLKSVLDVALAEGEKKNSAYLLDQKTQPDIISCFCAAQGGRVDSFKRLDGILKTQTNQQHKAILREACLDGHTEICVYLLDWFPSLLPQKHRGEQHCLHLIAQSGNLDCFKTVVALTMASTNTKESLGLLRDEEGQTVLHTACMYGRKNVCIYLIHKFPYLVSLRDINTYHCLHSSAWSGHIECFTCVADFILRGKDKAEREIFMATLTNKADCTVLHRACDNGKTEMCSYLIGEFPTLLPLRDTNRLHCLHYIAANGDIECFERVSTLTLQDKNKEESERFMETLTDEFGRTVLHLASVNGKTDMCSYLINGFPTLLPLRDTNRLHCHYIAANGDIECFERVSTLTLQDKNKEESERFMETLTDEEGRTVLPLASVNGNTEMCSYLIKGLPLRYTNRLHCLHYIAANMDIECFERVSTFALQGKNKEESERFMETLTDEEGRTVLHLASVNGKTEMCSYLINGFPTLLPLRDTNRLHCLHYIAANGDIKCFERVSTLTLQDKNKEESERFMETLTDKFGRTVLHLASDNGKTEMCSYLINGFPTLLPLRDTDRLHCLHYIAHNGNIKCFKCVYALTLQGKNKEESERFMETLTDEEGATVLHLASDNGKTEMCSYLINGFPTLLPLRDTNRLHCLHYIAHNGNIKCFKCVYALTLQGKNKEESERFMETLTNEDGMTVLDVAFVHGKTELCSYLIKGFPTLLPLRDTNRLHCLHHIAANMDIECFERVSTFALQGKNKEERERFMETLTNEDGMTVLDVACLNGKTEICSYLIDEFPTLLPLRDNYNCHCLHYIAYNGNIECFKCVSALTLQDKNKEESERFMETLTNEDGMTVLDIAFVNGKTEMCSYLIGEYFPR